MQLLPLSLCLLTLTGSTFSDGNGPVIVRVKEGDNVILPCKINKDISLERFEWKKDGKKGVYLHEYSPLPGQDEEFRGRVSHFDHELKNGNASIKISDTKVSDSGDYTCDFPNLVPKQTFTVRLVVGKAAKVSIQKPEQTEDGFLLQCLVSDVSPGFKLNISWFDSSGNKLIEEINNTESEKLHILQTTVKKSDTYRCVATMEELSHQVHSEVHVQIPGSDIPVVVWVVLAVMALIIVAAAGVICKMKRPVFITVTEGDAVTLPCNIKINILSKQFKWKKDGEEVDFLNEDGLLLSQDDQFRGRVSQLKNGDASIKISDTKVSDSGFYTCHFLCFQTSTVRLRVEPLIITVTEGDDATLPCNIKNKNKNIESQRFEWKKDGKNVYLYEGGQLPDDQDDHFKGRVLNRGHSYLKNGDASITIYDTELSDSGVYTCHFPNLHQTFTVRLVVEKRERRPEGRLIKVTEGRIVTLPCDIIKDIRSEQFEWKKDGKDVYPHKDEPVPGQDKKFKGRVSLVKNGNASITIRGTKVSDSGVYTCHFPKRNQTVTVRLLVEPLIITVTEGDKATLPCNIKNENIESLWFEWKKDGKKVYLYEGGQGSVQDEEFSKRVSHSDHELKNGDASITISYTKLSDDGFYTCNFPNLHQTFTVRLVIGKRESDPTGRHIPYNIFEAQECGDSFIRS